MTIRVNPESYQASNGRSFPTKREAMAYQRVLEARQKFDDARDLLGRQLVAAEKTADGVPFELSQMIDYYAVVDQVDRKPFIRKVEFSPFSMRWGEYTDGLQIADWRSVRQENSPQYWSIANLYRHEDNARKALAVALKRYIDDCQADLAKLESLGKAGR